MANKKKGKRGTKKPEKTGEEVTQSDIIGDVPNILRGGTPTEDINVNVNPVEEHIDDGENVSNVKYPSKAESDKELEDSSTSSSATSGDYKDTNNSHTMVKPYTRGSSNDLEEEIDVVEPRMVHTAIIEKDNPFLSKSQDKDGESLSDISKAKVFTTATEKSQNIRNPNDDYVTDNQSNIIDHNVGSELDSGANPGNSLESTDNSLQQTENIYHQNASLKVNLNDSNNENNNESKNSSHKSTNNSDSNIPKVQILEVNKISEGQGRTYIAYTIQFGGNSIVKRRYSDFENLRNILIKLFPMVIIPPIPEKQSLKNYGKAIAGAGSNYILPTDENLGSVDLSLSIINGTVNNQDEKLIRRRVRMLSGFLNKLLQDEEISSTSIINDFLDPNNQNWNDFVASSATFSALPKNVLQCNPVNPTSATRLHASLPIPSSSIQYNYPKPRKADTEEHEDDLDRTEPRISFRYIEEDYKNYETLLNNQYKYNKRITRNFNDMKQDYKDISDTLLQYYSKENGLADITEQLFYLNTTYEESATMMEALVSKLYYNINEPLSDSVHLAGSVRDLIKYHKMKFIQKELIRKELLNKVNQLKKINKENENFSQVDKIIDEEASKSQQIKFERPNDAIQSTYSERLFKGFSKIATIVKDTVNYQEIDPKTMTTNLENDIKELKELLTLAENDLKIISDEIRSKQLQKFSEVRERESSIILKQYSNYMKTYAEKNLKLWKELKKRQEE